MKNKESYTNIYNNIFLFDFINVKFIIILLHILNKFIYKNNLQI